MRGRDVRRARARAARDGRPARGRGVALPARVLGRPAAAHRHRARARRRTRTSSSPTSRCRRSTSRSRRRSSTCSRTLQQDFDAHVPLHRARPRGRAPHLRPDRRDVPRRHRRAVAGRRALRAPAAPVHDLAALGGADPRPGDRAEARARSCSTATCRARRTRPPAAGSTRAARSCSRRAAATRGRSCASSRADHVVACHWAEEIQAGELTPHEHAPVFDPGLVAAAPEPPPD